MAAQEDRKWLFSKIVEQVSVPDGLNVTVSFVVSAVSTHFWCDSHFTWISEFCGVSCISCWFLHFLSLCKSFARFGSRSWHQEKQTGLLLVWWYASVESDCDTILYILERIFICFFLFRMDDNFELKERTKYTITVSF